MITSFKLVYDSCCAAKTDINEHLPILYEYAKRCQFITEMGVRDGQSTSAFLYANPLRLISYDLNIHPVVQKWFNAAQASGWDYHYIEANTLEIEIEPTEFLFIDTLHQYGQLKKELKLHADKVSKYIAFHDTVTYGQWGQDPSVEFGYNGGMGIAFAINQFLIMNKEWKVVHEATHNNGLLIIERQNEIR